MKNVITLLILASLLGAGCAKYERVSSSNYKLDKPNISFSTSTNTSIFYKESPNRISRAKNGKVIETVEVSSEVKEVKNLQGCAYLSDGSIFEDDFALKMNHFECLELRVSIHIPSAFFEELIYVKKDASPEEIINRIDIEELHFVQDVALKREKDNEQNGFKDEINQLLINTSTSE